MAISKSSSAVTYHADLTLSVMEYMASGEGFVADTVAPVVPVTAMSDFFWKFPKGAWMDAPNNLRGRGGSYHRDNTPLEQDTYTCLSRGLEEKMPIEDQVEYSRWFGLANVVSLRKANQMRLSREERVLDMMFNRTNFPIGTLTGHDASNEWDDFTNATPITDVLLGVRAISIAGGGMISKANLRMLVSEVTYWNLCQCNQIRDGEIGLKYADTAFKKAILPPDVIARVLGIGGIDISGAAIRTGGSIDAPVVGDLADPDFALLYVKAQGNRDGENGLAVTFANSPLGGLLSVNTYTENQVSSDILQVNEFTVEKFTNQDAGYLIGNLKTP